MRRTDHAPAEESEERSEIGEPGEDLGAAIADVEIGQSAADDQGEGQTGPGTADFVCFAEELSESAKNRGDGDGGTYLWCHLQMCKTHQCTRTGIHLDTSRGDH
jgi:hypothetical protein